jgi:hypothetical protein
VPPAPQPHQIHQQFYSHGIATFVLDPEGRIRYRVEGTVAWDDPKVARQIAALLPKLPARAAKSGTGSGKALQPAAPRSD